MTIEFKNGSKIETIPDANQNVRGERSNYYSTLCLDTENDEQPVYVMVILDWRKPLGRYMPVWMLEDHEDIQKLYDYRKHFDKNPAECMEEMFGVKLYWYQKAWINAMCKTKKIWKRLW